MSYLRALVGLFIAIIPSNSARIFLYRNILGYMISGHTRIAMLTLLLARQVEINSATIGPLNLIRINALQMDEGALIGKLNMFRKLKMLHLSNNAYILHRNFIGGTFGTSVECGREELHLGRQTQISLSSFFDLSDRITLGENVVIAGAGTQFWTHGFDHRRERSVAPINIGNNVFIGSASTVVQGIQICDDVTVGAGTVVHRTISEPGLYVSSCLRKVGDK